MTVRQLVVVGLRFFAIWLCISALQTFVYLTNMQHANGLAEVVPGAYYVIGFLVSAAVVLWMLARQVANAVLAGVPVAQAPSLSLADLVVAGCVLLGLWWFKDAAAGLIDSWIKAQVAGSMNGQSAFASMDFAARARAGYFVGETLVAGLLLTRPFAVARWALRLPATHESVPHE